jgi:hypothetical protein
VPVADLPSQIPGLVHAALAQPRRKKTAAKKKTTTKSKPRAKKAVTRKRK